MELSLLHWVALSSLGFGVVSFILGIGKMIDHTTSVCFSSVSIILALIMMAGSMAVS